MCNAPCINVFKQNILNFIHLGPNKVLNIYNPHDLKLLTRLRLGLSHLWGHKFFHNFSDRLDEICMCGKDIESTEHFHLQCSLFFKERQLLMNKTCSIDRKFIEQNENSVLHFLLVKRTWMAVIIPIFLMQHYSISSQQTGSTFHYLNKSNKSLPLQLIMTTIINDPILFKLTPHFCFFFFILFVS